MGLDFVNAQATAAEGLFEQAADSAVERELRSQHAVFKGTDTGGNHEDVDPPELAGLDLGDALDDATDAGDEEELEDLIGSVPTIAGGEMQCLLYDSYLQHQRYYDDFKHANHGAIAYTFSASPQSPCLIVQQDVRLGKGGFCWDCGFVLAEHLLANTQEWLELAIAAASAQGRRPRILELGSGTGLTGLALAQHCDCDVVVTDLPEILPLLEKNVEVNKLGEQAPGRGTASVAKLTWGDEADIAALEGEGAFDIILGADCVCLLYSDTSLAPDALTKTIRRLSGPQTVLYAAMKKRLAGPVKAFSKDVSGVFSSVSLVDPQSRNRNPDIVLTVAKCRDPGAEAAAAAA